MLHVPQDLTSRLNLVRCHTRHTNASKHRAFDCTGIQCLLLNHKPKASFHATSVFMQPCERTSTKSENNISYKGSKAPVRTLTMLQSKICIKFVWVSRCAWRCAKMSETLKSVTFKYVIMMNIDLILDQVCWLKITEKTLSDSKTKSQIYNLTATDFYTKWIC